MTVDTSTNKVSYTGDGSTTEFAVPFLFFANSHISVTLDGTAWDEDTDYTLTGAGVESGGTLTATTAPSSGTTLIIQRVVPETQNTDFENFDGNPADVTEKQFDLVVMMIQQLSEKVGRCIKAAVDTVLTNFTLPEPEADTYLGWNSGGTALENKTAVDTTAISLPLGTSNISGNAITYEKLAVAVQEMFDGRWNFAINGGMRVNQDTDSDTITGGPVYGGGPDMFACEHAHTGSGGASAGTFDHTASASWSATGNAAHASGLTTTGTGNVVVFYHRLPEEVTYQLNGKTVIVRATFYHDVGTDVDCNIVVRQADSKDDFSTTTAIHTGSTNTVSSATATTVTTSFDVGASEGEKGWEIRFRFFGLGAVTTKNFYLADVGLFIGNEDPGFSEPDYATTLAQCQRFYQVHSVGFVGAATSTTTIWLSSVLPTEMHSDPSVALKDTSPSIHEVGGAGSVTGSGSSLTTGAVNTRGANLIIDGFSGLTAGTPVFTLVTTDDDAFEFDARL